MTLFIISTKKYEPRSPFFEFYILSHWVIYNSMIIHQLVENISIEY